MAYRRSAYHRRRPEWWYLFRFQGQSFGHIAEIRGYPDGIYELLGQFGWTVGTNICRKCDFGHGKFLLHFLFYVHSFI